MEKEQKNITIDDLAVMVENGFKETRADLHEVKSKVDDIDKNVKEINMKVHDIEESISNHTNRIGQLEEDVKELQEA